MLMITACIAAALLLVALPIGLSVINHPRRRGE
jgi:hypothetical protein